MAGTFLRKRKQQASAEQQAEGRSLLPDTETASDPSAQVVPPWAEPLLCGSKAAKCGCGGGECEMLHFSHAYMTRPCRSPRGGKGKVIICAGPERSGSTWLFNAVRIMLQSTGERVHSYWIQHLTQSALQKRGLGREGPESAHLVIKTHHWSNEWEPSSVDVIFLTERDVVGVVNSYLRVGWLSPGLDTIVPVMEQYVQEHGKWKAIASEVVPFEDISTTGPSEIEQLSKLRKHVVSEDSVVDLESISAQVAALPVPGHHMDLVTKLWPLHVSKRGPLTRKPIAALSEEEAEELKRGLAPLSTD